MTSQSPDAPPSALSRALRRLPLPSERALRILAYASLATQAGIIVTGGAVRLTDSGLGCPEWPRCTEESWTASPEMGSHGALEFGNRLLTFVLGVVALAMLLAVVRTLVSHRPRRDLLYPAIFLLGVIPAQAVIGGITVWTGLNPWVVQFHYLVSAVLVGVATVMVRRARRPAAVPPQPAGTPWLERLALVMLAAVAITIYMGTVTTGSGPHAGDPDAPRIGFDITTVTQFHVHAAVFTLGLAIGVFFAARLSGSAPHAARASARLVGVLVVQGAIGGMQYGLGLPEVLVALHLAGSALIVMAAVDTWYVTRWMPPEQPPASARPARQPAASE
ncbi:COX15/CtaA family protein [Phytoactinopolyspora halophila]|uniref:COX15/CtaA family protein n=1 Tax=Phytoactinopolyspora halophila TaxID=1981511 RepID=UPI0013142979|nr:COX15/CtaA family protein [Phytoactinopolyspora halophila]